MLVYQRVKHDEAGEPDETRRKGAFLLANHLPKTVLLRRKNAGFQDLGEQMGPCNLRTTEEFHGIFHTVSPV